jgi:hypothetical protein
MKPLNVEIIDSWYRRPGLSKVKFIADYGIYMRRGTVVFDTNKQHFLTHRSDIDLVYAVCVALREPKNNKAES